MNKNSSFARRVARLSAVGTGLVVAGVTAAQAAVPADVTTSLADMKADGLVVAGAILVAILAIAAVKFLRKAV